MLICTLVLLRVCAIKTCYEIIPGCIFRRRRGEGKKTSTATAPDEPDTPGVEFKVPPFGESMGDFFPGDIIYANV